MNTANEYLAQFLGGSSTASSPTIIVASMGLDNIDWEKIQEKVNGVAKSIATFLNGIFETEGLQGLIDSF